MPCELPVHVPRQDKLHHGQLEGQSQTGFRHSAVRVWNHTALMYHTSPVGITMTYLSESDCRDLSSYETRQPPGGASSYL